MCVHGCLHNGQSTVVGCACAEKLLCVAAVCRMATSLLGGGQRQSQHSKQASVPVAAWCNDPTPSRLTSTAVHASMRLLVHGQPATGVQGTCKLHKQLVAVQACGGTWFLPVCQRAMVHVAIAFMVALGQAELPVVVCSIFSLTRVLGYYGSLA